MARFLNRALRTFAHCLKRRLGGCWSWRWRRRQGERQAGFGLEKYRPDLDKVRPGPPQSFPMNEPATKPQLTIPTKNVAAFICELSEQYDIRPTVTAADRWAATVKRAGLISAHETAALLVNFLQEERRVDWCPWLLCPVFREKASPFAPSGRD